jgi:aspartyl-tRNA(Asn)/glutamyl-tRNA(Gln) amidotransferase subunit C
VSLDEGTLAHLGRLARIRLTPEEAEQLRHDLARILAYVAALDSIDTGGPSPAPTGPGVQEAREGRPEQRGQPERPEHLREDRVEPGLTQEEALTPAPEVLDGHFAVPAVLEAGRRRRAVEGGHA